MSEPKKDYEKRMSLSLAGGTAECIDILRNQIDIPKREICDAEIIRYALLYIVLDENELREWRGFCHDIHRRRVSMKSDKPGFLAAIRHHLEMKFPRLKSERDAFTPLGCALLAIAVILLIVIFAAFVLEFPILGMILPS